jgi:branched-chain amino acid transport system ATP-binding protein
VTALLELRDVTMRFGGFVALESVSLEVADGAAAAIVGPNGAGKTTLLNCLCAMYRPTAGRIFLRGQRLDRLRPHQVVARGVGRTFQSVEQFRELSPLRLALIGRHQRFRSGLAEAGLTLPRSGREERENAQACLELLAALGIERYAGERLERLPYAVRKLADLARALAGEPELLLLDEPGAGMGAGEKEQLVRVLERMRGAAFKTLVMIDHDIRLVQDLCRHVVVLDFGRKIAEGEASVVFRDRQVVEAYLGVPVSEKEGG